MTVRSTGSQTENTLQDPPLQAVYRNIEEYYAVAGPDYKTWSRHFNMHFGYCRHWADIFNLEKMLRQMNEVVLDELRVFPGESAVLADLGCGMATVARQAAMRYPRSHILACTIVKEHVHMATAMNKAAGLEDRIRLLHENFENLSLNSNSCTHVYAIESACHAASKGKESFISEMARILRKGGRFCIADGFLKREKPGPAPFEWLYQRMIRYWAVPGFASIGQFTKALEMHGLKKISVREISYRIAPSVLHIPRKCLQFFGTEIFRSGLRMPKERWHNVYAPLLGMFTGLFRKQFGYYLVSGEK